jgi:hypothetical protein
LCTTTTIQSIQKLTEARTPKGGGEPEQTPHG